MDDFFHILLAEHNAAASEAVPATELPLQFLASFLTAPGGRALALAPTDVNVEHLRQELTQKISEEASSVHVYTKHWRSTGSVEALPQRHVLQETRRRLLTHRRIGHSPQHLQVPPSYHRHRQHSSIHHFAFSLQRHAPMPLSPMPSPSESSVSVASLGKASALLPTPSPSLSAHSVASAGKTSASSPSGLSP